MARRVPRKMAAHQASGKQQSWQCLHCRAPLTSSELGLQCHGCGRHYPLLGNIPLLVREPAAYFRAERASLIQAAREARQHSGLLDRIEPYAGLPEAALERHRDVLDVEATQAETLLALLDSSARPLGMPTDSSDELQVVRPGWNVATLVPYLLRDWTNTAELRTASARIGAALKYAGADPRGISIALAGCGAGGLLAQIPGNFARVVGFDLTLPILAAARRLLDGQTLDLALPRVMHEKGLISLGNPDGASTQTPVELVAMDALDTAFADRSIDCVVTAFLTDILADPRDLADEVHRVLPDNGIWINFGPSGNNLKALWRFDQTEAAAFFRTAGFTVIEAEAQRGTNLDISGVCPSVSFRNAVVYLTVARKTGDAEPRPTMRAPGADELRHIVPQHFPGARLVHSLEAGGQGSILLEHDRIPARAGHWQLGGGTARMMVLVDGKRTVGEIADLLSRKQPPHSFDDTVRAFGRWFNQGILIPSGESIDSSAATASLRADRSNPLLGEGDCFGRSATSQ